MPPLRYRRGLTVAWASFHQVALAWEDDAEASAWRVWRNGELAAETTQDSFFEDGLAAGMEWSYSVAAVDAAGVSGTAAVAAQYTYTVNGDGTIRTRTNYGNAGEWEETRRDFLGRPVRTDYPDGTFALREYDAQGRVAREVSPRRPRDALRIRPRRLRGRRRHRHGLRRRHRLRGTRPGPGHPLLACATGVPPGPTRPVVDFRRFGRHAASAFADGRVRDGWTWNSLAS